PGVSKRYAEFMAFTQGVDPATATQWLTFTGGHRLYRMLRLRYVFEPGQNGLTVGELADPMGRFAVIRDWRLLPDRDEIFRAMASDAFDPTPTIILEQPVATTRNGSQSSNRDVVDIVDDTTDQFTVTATLGSPGLLLLTDGYDRDWHARALSGSTQ